MRVVIVMVMVMVTVTVTVTVTVAVTVTVVVMVVEAECQFQSNKRITIHESTDLTFLYGVLFPRAQRFLGRGWVMYN